MLSCKNLKVPHCIFILDKLFFFLICNGARLDNWLSRTSIELHQVESLALCLWTELELPVAQTAAICILFIFGKGLTRWGPARSRHLVTSETADLWRCVTRDIELHSFLWSSARLAAQWTSIEWDWILFNEHVWTCYCCSSIKGLDGNWRWSVKASSLTGHWHQVSTRNIFLFAWRGLRFQVVEHVVRIFLQANSRDTRAQCQVHHLFRQIQTILRPFTNFVVVNKRKLFPTLPP